jgi:hypothetical protein
MQQRVKLKLKWVNCSSIISQFQYMMLQKYSTVISNLDRLVFSLLNYQTLDQKQSLRTEDYSSVECDVDFDAKWEIPRENLVLGDVLGEGAFGVVRKGVLQEGGNWRDVAVKMLRGSCNHCTCNSRHQIACFNATEGYHHRAALSQQYSVASCATLRVLSCLHSPVLRCSCCNIV